MIPKSLINQFFIEKAPANHTDQLKIIKVIDVMQFYELNPKGTQKINYTYVFYQTCSGQNYPVPNYTEDGPVFLDGTISNIKYITFKSKFIPYTKKL